MLPDRRRRCSVLPYCGACRAVWSERRRRGCICSPPPIGGNHDRLNLLRLRGSRHHYRSRGGRRCREHKRGKSGRRRTRLARNRWDRRSLARLQRSRYRRRSRSRRRDRCCCKHRRGKSGRRRSRRDRRSLARLRGSRYWRRSRGRRWARDDAERFTGNGKAHSGAAPAGGFTFRSSGVSFLDLRSVRIRKRLTFEVSNHVGQG